MPTLSANLQTPEPYTGRRVQIQLFQKQQVLRNDLIDGNANPFPLAEQKDRLRKQNVDEDHLRQFQVSSASRLSLIVANDGLI